MFRPGEKVIVDSASLEIEIGTVLDPAKQDIRNIAGHS
eukprot:gene372-173_t